MAAPTLRGPSFSGLGSGDAALSGNVITVYRPTSAVAGDTIVVFLAGPGGAAQTYAAPDASWSEQVDIATDLSGTCHLGIFTHILEGGAPGSWAFTVSGDAAMQEYFAYSLAYYSASPISVYGVSALEDTTGATVTGADTATLNANDLVLTGIAMDNTGSDGTWVATSPAAMSIVRQLWSGTPKFFTLAVLSEERVAAGQAPHAATYSGTGDLLRGGVTGTIVLTTTGPAPANPVGQTKIPVGMLGTRRV